MYGVNLERRKNVNLRIYKTFVCGSVWARNLVSGNKGGT
jgi:hypothetical protein